MRPLHSTIILIFLMALVPVLSGFSRDSERTASARMKFTAAAYAPVAPVLKYARHNAVLRLLVSVSDAGGSLPLKQLFCRVNPSALALISKIEVYNGPAGPFNPEELVATVEPSSPLFPIPVNVALTNGVRFLWFSVLLKEDAPIDGKIELHCTGVTAASGIQYPVKESGGLFEKRIGVAVKKIGDAGVNTYRIPGLVTTDKGTLIAVYDIRYTSSGDLPGNIDVGMSRSIDGGKTWEPMKVIMDMGPPHENNGIGDPAVLYDAQTRTLWVAALWSKGNRSIAGSLPGLSPDTTGQFVLCKSVDDGVTWSRPYSITAQVKDPAWHLFFQGPGNGMVMKDGKLVFAAQYWNEKKVPYSTIIYSDDRGSTWKGKIQGPKSNTTESQVVETSPGTLMLNMRDNRGGFRSVATSRDMGLNWSEHQTSYNALTDPVCMGSLIKARVKVKGQLRDVLFFSNPASVSGRINMTVRASLDFGETWLPAHELLYDERSCFGYSSITAIDEEHIGILYEGVRELYFVKVPVQEIIK